MGGLTLHYRPDLPNLRNHSAYIPPQSLVIAGLSDLTRPADKISPNGCLALGATNLIWTRYSLVIIPKNYSLFAVNLFVSLTQLFQLGRYYNYQWEQSRLEKNGEQCPAIEASL